jgi:hypothetical protein
MTWALVGFAVWIGLILFVMSLCAAAGRADRARGAFPLGDSGSPRSGSAKWPRRAATEAVAGAGRLEMQAVRADGADRR